MLITGSKARPHPRHLTLGSTRWEPETATAGGKRRLVGIAMSLSPEVARRCAFCHARHPKGPRLQATQRTRVNLAESIYRQNIPTAHLTFQVRWNWNRRGTVTGNTLQTEKGKRKGQVGPDSDLQLSGDSLLQCTLVHAPLHLRSSLLDSSSAVPTSHPGLRPRTRNSEQGVHTA